MGTILTIATGVLFALIGAVLTIGGVQLVGLGSTWYYLLAGLGLVASGILLVLRRREGYWLYLLVFVGTLLWSLIGVGFDGWKLMPRLLAPAVMLLWVSLPFITRSLSRGPAGANWTATRWAGAGLALASLVLVFASGWAITHARWNQYQQVAAALPTAPVGRPIPAGDWVYYGRDQAGTRFTPLTQITRDNVGRLELAWRFDTGDMPKPSENSGGKEFNFEATPIKVGDSVYLCTPHRDVIALDAVTCRQRWRYSSRGDTSANVYLACRGVAYYKTAAAPGTAGVPGNPTVPANAVGACAERIISTTADARLFELDAASGRPCTGFGRGGFVSLRQGLGPTPHGFHFISSQPMVAGGKIILSGWVYDNQAKWGPSGVIRAFDATTGELAWAWDMGRTPATKPLAPGEMYTRGTPNGWGTYTADETLGLVYIPLGNATPDYFGAHRRPFDDEYSSSVVALDIGSGQERWHYQTVHHDVWDFDVPIGPSLVDIPNGHGDATPALIQTTKRGALFVLDRRTGHPIVDTVEMPVPQNGVPGEKLSPTQPFVTGFPSLTPPKFDGNDVWGATPIDQMVCRIDFAQRRYDGEFTPPTLGHGNIGYPAFDGIIDWHGATIDPTRKLLIANTSYIPFTYQMKRHDQAVKDGDIPDWKGWNSGQSYPAKKIKTSWNPQYGTPYAVKIAPWLNFLKVPCLAPPWGKMVAIDIARREIAWERPVGTTRDMGPFGTNTDLPLPTGMFNIGGNIVTGSGLIFVGAYGDDYLRAIDERTGKILWRVRLPAGGQATPASYQGRDGRQYVIISAGGHGGLGTVPGDSVLAYALPRR